MDTFSAVPRIQRFPITVVDQERLEEFYASEDPNAEIPTKTKVFIGYEKGSYVPARIRIEVDGIETEYEQSRPTEEEIQKMTLFEYNDSWRRRNMLLRRNLLLAVIHGLDKLDADVLASEDDGPGREILVRLGWLLSREEMEKAQEENEKEGEGETGE